ncbi:hypothetical protein NPIL_112921 [Nephila pilipes]|uniref:Uncharacterized protein n=1 Tax=Nephila pilipes TaxID=299642 RepID=A0A8X6Q0Q4_NEPPI|nr:hypothetical protein NPIL_112921 [Nephila pilipes]
MITVDLQIEEALANNVYVFIIPDSTQPVDLLVGDPYLDLPHIAYASISEELRIGTPIIMILAEWLISFFTEA